MIWIQCFSNLLFVLVWQRVSDNECRWCQGNHKALQEDEETCGTSDSELDIEFRIGYSWYTCPPLISPSFPLPTFHPSHTYTSPLSMSQRPTPTAIKRMTLKNLSIHPKYTQTRFSVFWSKPCTHAYINTCCTEYTEQYRFILTIFLTNCTVSSGLAWVYHHHHSCNLLKFITYTTSCNLLKFTTSSELQLCHYYWPIEAQLF